MSENIYVTWHLPTHGIGYTKNIMAAFFGDKCRIGEDIDIKAKQIEMERMFNEDSKAFLFDKIYYLHTDQQVINKITTARPSRRIESMERDNVIGQSGTKKIWKAIFENGKEGFTEEAAYLSQEFPEQKDKVISQYWRLINDYTIKDQLLWFTEYSNFSPYIQNRFKPVNMTRKGVEDLRDYIQIAKAVQGFVQKLKRDHPEAHFVFNISLGSYETQVVWFCLAEAGLLPSNTQFIASYDDKSNTPINKRFRDFYIKTRPITIITTIKDLVNIYSKSKSELRKLANLKMKNYIKAGFAILLVGERGIGKTRLVNKYKDSKSVVSVNCASFDNDDHIAEVKLFGTKKGAYSGAKDKIGLFEEAKGGILFLDEIHHLSKGVQAKLMLTLGTDENNNFTVTKVGTPEGYKVKCTFIAATNKSIGELKEILLPDFFDRIAQLVIELPPLRKTVEDRMEDWKIVWKELQFESENAPSEPELKEWLQKLELHGNFRDLQKIAMYYHRFTTFPPELKELLPQKTALLYAKSEYKKYHLANANISYQFSRTLTPDKMVKDFKAAIATWAFSEFKPVDEFLEHVEGLGGKMSRKTLYNWRDKK